MAPASGRRCRVVFVQKEQHAAQLPRAKQTAPPAQEDAPLFHEQCPSKTEQRRPCRLKLRRWQRNCESCSSIGAQHQADRIAGDDTGEVAEPEIDSPLTSLNDGSNGSNFYPIFVGESVLESRDSIEPQLLQSLLLSPSGESSSVTSLHFFVDGSLPRQHLDLVESFAQRLGCSECFPGPRSGAEAAALSPSGSSHQQLPKTQQGPLLPATGSPCPATQASCSQEQLTSDPAGLSGLPQRPVRLWFLKGELGEGLKCREALIEVQDALIFDNPSHSRRTHYITTLSNRLPKDNRDKPVATCTDISPSSPVPPVERRDAGSTAKSSPFDRRSLVFAVGGGTVCDLVGFAAATALRGVKCVLVPTTLLAAVDAAVGGKNGIDVGAAKNCLGTFAHPHAVLVHLPFLRSLSPRHFANGMAEVIKIATTSSTELFEFLSRVDPAALVAAVADSSEPSATGASNDPRKRPSASPALRASDARTVDGKDAVGRAKRGRVRQTPSEEPLIGLSADTAASHREAAGQRDVVDTPRRRLFAADPDMREGMNSALETVILAAIQLKAAVVAEDFREGGKRQILNFGHTIGHGIEMLSRSSDWLHGESVAVGMVLELLLLRLLGLVSPLLSIRVQRLLRKFSLPCSAALSPKDAEEACRLILAHDKKNRAGNVFVTHVLDVGSTHPRHVTAVPHELVRLVLSPVLALAPHRPCLPCSSLRSVAGHTASLPFDAVVSLPGSKSVANRVLLLAALRHCFIPSFRQPMHARPSRERFVLSNLPAAVDVVVMVHALQQLGLYGEFEFVASPSSSSFDLKAEIPLSCKASRSSPSDGPYFDPLAFASVSEGCLRLWVGDSGTASRFLLPFVAFLLVLHHCLHRTHGRQGCPASSPHVDSKSRGKELASERFPNVHSIVVDGGDQLRRRPMGSLAEAISRIVRGCRVSYLKTHGCLPIQLDVDEKVVAQAPTLMDYQEAQNPHADTTLRLMSRVFTDVTEWHVSASESSQFGSALLMLAPLAPYSVQLCLDIVDEQTDQQSEAPHSRVSQQQRQPGTSGEDRPRSWETPEGTCSLSSSPAVSTTSPSCHRKRMREECGTELVDAKYAGDGGSASGRRQYRDPPSAAVNPFVLMTQRLMRQWRFGVSQISSHSYQVCSVWPGVRGDCSTGQESGGRLAKAMKRAGVRKRDSCPQRGPDNFHEEAPASETAARRLSPEHGSPEGTRQQGVDDQKGEASEMTSADSPDLHSPAHWIVEADATAASYFMAMAAVAGGRVHLNVDRSASLQGDVAFTELLPHFGCSISQRYGCPRQLFAHLTHNDSCTRSTPCRCPPHCPGSGSPRREVGVAATGEETGNVSKNTKCPCCSGAWLTVESTCCGLLGDCVPGSAPKSALHPHAPLHGCIRDGMPPDLETHSQGREERPARDDLPAQLSGQGGQTLRGRGPLPRALHKLEIPSIASSAGASADPVLTLDLSQMQDCFMTCAVLAAIASRGTTTSNADSCLLQEPADATAKRLLLTSVARRPVFHLKAGRTARLKESDRIAAAARGLKATGFHVDELPDGLLIGDIRMSPLPSGGSTAAPQRALTKHEKNGDEREGIGEDLAKLSGQGASTSPEMRDVEKSEQVEVTAVDSESDHRVAMSFAILGLVRTNVGIRDWQCVDKTFADFWYECKERIGMHIYAPSSRVIAGREGTDGYRESLPRDRLGARDEAASRSTQSVTNIPEEHAGEKLWNSDSRRASNRQALGSPEVPTRTVPRDTLREETELNCTRCGGDRTRMGNSCLCGTKRPVHRASVTREELQRYFLVCTPPRPSPSLVPGYRERPSQCAKPVPHLSPPSLHKTPTAPAAQPPDEHSQSLSPQVLLLVGMRGVGKSVLGKLAALEREWAFFDLDVVLEAWLRDREDAIRAPVDARLGRHRAVIDLSGTTDVSLLKLNRLRGFIEEEGMHAFREVESQALAFLLSSLRRMRTQNVSCARSAAEADARTQADEDLCKSRHQYPNSELCSIFNSVDERVSEAQAMRNLENPREPTDRLSVSTEQPMGRVDKLVHSDASLQEFLMRCEALGLLKCHSGGCVVSCGGGVVEGEGAMKLLEAEPLVVWVNATEQETVERALRKEGQAPSYFQPPKKATRSAAAEMGCIPSDSNGGGQQGGHSEQGTSVAVAARYREKVRLLYRERAVRYKKVAKFEFWTPPVQELLEGLDSFELSWWPMLSDSKTSVPPLGPPAGTASNCIPSVPSSSTFGPSSEVDAGARSFPASSASRPALPLPHLPTSVADHLAVAHPKEAQRLSLYLRAVHKVWQLFLFALLGPPLPVTPASCFVVCEEVLNWAAGSEATSHSQAGDGAYCRNPLDSPPECQAAQGGGASTAAAHHTKLTTWLEESRYVDAVELRADCLPALEAIERQAFYLRLLTGKPLIFTLRTQQDGGRFGPGNALYKEALALLLSGVCDGSENGATQLDDSFIRSGEEDKAHSSRGRTSPTSGGEPRFREPNGADQARSGSVRNDARSADFPKTELTAPVGHASSSGVPSESRSATNLSFAEEELHAVTEAAAYVSALSRASRLGFDWIDVEVRQVERLHTREERAAAETRKELWARAACRTAVWRPSEEPRTSHTGREAESSRFDSRASASADPTSRPVHARRFSAVSEDSEETTENSLLRGARRQFVEDIIMATPPGGRYIASLHVAWVSERDSDPVKRFYRHCLSSVACWYADVAKIVLAPPQSRLPAQTPLQERTSALEPGLVSAGESKPTNLQVPVLSQDGGDPGEGEESVACLLRSLVMGCASPPQSLNTDTAPRANGEQSRALRSEAGMPNGLELLIQRPLILLQSGAAGRLSRIENRCLTPTCLAGQDTTNVYGQLSATRLWEHRRRHSLPCVNFFLFGYPTMFSPSPTIHNAIFKCKGATAGSCAFSLFPPASVQWQMQQITCPAPEVDTRQPHAFHAVEATAPVSRCRPSAKSPGRETDRETETYCTRLVEQMAWQFLRAAPLHTFGGAAVTLPLKETLVPLLSRVDPTAKRIKAVNTVYRDKRDGLLCGINTDYAAIVKAILSRCDKLSFSSSFLVVGAGGAARAAVCACLRIRELLRDSAVNQSSSETHRDGGAHVRSQKHDAWGRERGGKTPAAGQVFIYNRTRSRAEKLAQEFGVSVFETPAADKTTRRCRGNWHQITVIVGTVPGTARCELPEEVFQQRPLVVDMAYNPVLTPLVKKACGAGCEVVHGIELFVWQALIQSRYWVTSQGLAEGKAGEKLQASSDCRDGDESALHCIRGQTDQLQQVLTAKWLETEEGRSYRPIDLRPTELREILRSVEAFYRNVIDVEQLVTLREENFIF
uniref:3-dehydroquinate synthase, related n=1 Tax=Neospora caninum (strain Liverpool) TaxID=572307 RepID=A0A0F7UN13_NEOCL|nr:TPA: 3-dehydroquinate synthase, related [Neospora caninum Liverpool]